MGADFRLIDGLHIWILANLGNRFLLQQESTPSPSPSERSKESRDLFAPALGAELGLRAELLGPVGLELCGGLDLVFGTIAGEDTRFLVPWGRASLFLSF